MVAAQSTSNMMYHFEHSRMEVFPYLANLEQ